MFGTEWKALERKRCLQGDMMTINNQHKRISELNEYSSSDMIPTVLGMGSTVENKIDMAPKSSEE